MKKIYVCSPYRGDVKKNIENVKKYCAYVSFDGIPIAPHLYFTQFLDERFDRWKGMMWGLALLEECAEVHVFADEVSEGMIEEIKKAKELNIPIKFYDADRKEIKYDALIINKKIGVGYKTIIEEIMNPDGPKRICPYANACNGACQNSCEEKTEQKEAVQEIPKSEVTKEQKNEKADWRSKLMNRFCRSN